MLPLNGIYKYKSLKMPEKGTKIEGLTDFIQDEMIVNVLVTRLTTMFTPIMEGLFKQLAVDFSSSLSNTWKTWR